MTFLMGIKKIRPRKNLEECHISEIEEEELAMRTSQTKKNKEMKMTWKSQKEKLPADCDQ